MTNSATIRQVARPRGELTPGQIKALADLKWRADHAQEAYRLAVLKVLERGASFSEVSKATGLSTNTLQRWKREANRK